MSQPEPAFFSSAPGFEGITGARSGERAVDVLILTALQDELEAVLALGADWSERHDSGGFPYHRREFTREGGKRPLVVAAAWLGKMGRTATAIRGGAFLRELEPDCLAMCGICAGMRGETELGDVIIADKLYSFDEGKLVGEAGKGQELHHEIKTHDLHPLWTMNAASLKREIDLPALQAYRPPSKEAQSRWLLHSQHTHEVDAGPAPDEHPDQESACPDWTELLGDNVKKGLLLLKAGELSLTQAGREQVLNERRLYRKKLPRDPDLRVHVGTVGTGSAVQKDPGLFPRLRHVMRSTIGVEMEGAAIGELAQYFEKRGIVVKAVSDHGDLQKDDSFRKFACRASAEVLLAFLLKHVATEPTPVPEKALFEGDEDEPADDGPRGDRRLLVDRRDGFLARVERVALLRDPGATATRHRAAAPFAGVLEIAVRDGALVDLRIIAAVEQPITEQLVEQYRDEVEHRFRQQDPLLRSTLVHSGGSASVELAQLAFRRGVVLKSFGEYQRLFDFRGYLEKQTSRLDGDIVYPPALYVDQPARWSLAGGREEQATEDALATLWELLEDPHPRFALVLGDFGAGKTFLLHELARRMARNKHPLTPVLVEMSRLDKQPTIRGLLASHFGNAEVGRIDLDAFQYLLAEGRIALLFDGFDELALRLTYDRALEHFETVVEATKGNAKVVVTSRTQHFLTDNQVRLALANKAEQVQGYRLFQLDKFGAKQIQRFLGNLIKDTGEAEERYQLLDEVKDLLGLSENPRMLGFIAKIEPERLREAKAQSGEITAAKLYEVLIGQWLDFEFERVNPRGAPRGISRVVLGDLVSRLAGVFWERNAKALGIGEFREMLVADGIEPAVVEHMIGSGSLLVRDAEGRFSFIHRSVIEWIVADAAARELTETGDATALAENEVSELMADFLISLAGRGQAGAWALQMGRRSGDGAAKKNAAQVLKRIELLASGHADAGLVAPMDYAGQDFRGKDLSRVDWHGARLDGADLRSAMLIEAKLGGASLIRAKLGRANLVRADLKGADFYEANLSFARLLDADLRGALHIEARSLRGAMLVGARGVIVEGLTAVGAAPPAPSEASPMWGPESSPCNAVAWSRSGDLLASGHRDGAIRLWDAVSGRAIRTMAGHSGSVRSVAFSPDGNTLASGAEDTTVRLWDVATAIFLHAFSGHTGAVLSVAFSPDGRNLASGSQDTTVRLWDIVTASTLRTFCGHSKAVLSVAFSPDGTTLASGGGNTTVRLWNVATAVLLRAFAGHSNEVLSVAFNPEGDILASGSCDKTVRLWDVPTAIVLRTLSEHNGCVRSVAFSPNGDTLVSGSEDKMVRLWDVATANLIRSFSGHDDRVGSVAFNPDGNTLASGSEDKTVRVWDVATTRVSHICGSYTTNWLGGVAFSPDAKILAVAGNDAVHTWEAVTTRPLRSFDGHRNRVTSVAFSPDSRALASGAIDGIIRVSDIATARLLRAYEGSTNVVACVAFSPDGKTLAAGSYDDVVRLWDVATGRALPSCEGHTNWVTSVAFSSDLRTLASASNDGTVRIWDFATSRSVHTYEGHQDRVASVAFSPDGVTMASGSFDATVRLWNIATSSLRPTCEGHSDKILSVAFSPDGLTLASASYDKTVRLWNVATAHAVHICTGHAKIVHSVAFSPDGLTLASASADGTIRLWSVATAVCLAILLPSPEGWVAFTPDGRYKLGGDIAGSFWHVIGLCRFEPGELDPYLPHLRVPDNEPLFTLPGHGA